MGIRKHIENWQDNVMQRATAASARRPGRVLSTAEREAQQRAEADWQAQRDLPMRQRSRAWWLEEGVPVMVVSFFTLTVAAALVGWVLSLL